MRFDFRRQIVFLHILKTAGQSVMQILEHNFREEERLFANHAEIVNLPPKSLRKYKIIYGHNYYNIHQLLGRKPRYFTFLRDPLERTLSHYAYLRRAKYFKPVLSQNVEEFVSDPETRPHIANYQTRWIASNSFSKPAEQEDEGLLKIAKERLKEFAFVGIVEDFDRSLQIMAHVFHWELPVQMEIRNQGRNRPKMDELSTQGAELIRGANLLDYELYEYGSSLLQQQYGLFEKK